MVPTKMRQRAEAASVMVVQLENLLAREHNVEEIMKDGKQNQPEAASKKPAKAPVSDAEFRRRLKNISEWRKKRLAQLRAKDSR
ncbi:MAG TPA: hypothetical protein VJV21_05550 [Pyrinomonadaceae bacterium]|nr:hypothetical protein [Pyrinomonadaceae bacterium]